MNDEVCLCVRDAQFLGLRNSQRLPLHKLPSTFVHDHCTGGLCGCVNRSKKWRQKMGHPPVLPCHGEVSAGRGAEPVELIDFNTAY